MSLHPLDTLKTRLQSPNGFLKSGGFSQLYKGIIPVVLGSAPTCKKSPDNNFLIPPTKKEKKKNASANNNWLDNIFILALLIFNAAVIKTCLFINSRDEIAIFFSRQLKKIRTYLLQIFSNFFFFHFAAALFFVTYESIKLILHPAVSENYISFVHMGAASIAEMVKTLVSFHSNSIFEGWTFFYYKNSWKLHLCSLFIFF